MKYTLNQLEELVQEYLLTLSDEQEDESFGTYRRLAKLELEEFFEWLTNKEKENV